VLGAGRGWAQSVLNSPRARREFEQFLQRPDSLMLGVCNGAQFMTHIAQIIPGAQNWPVFTTNESRQFEARFSMVRINAQPKSVWFHGMEGSSLPIVSSHGEGRARFRNAHDAAQILADDQVCLQYVDNRNLRPTEVYPANPNGSPQGITGLTAAGGRVVAMMPHPERTILGGVASYVTPNKMKEWGDLGPWARMFASARRWIG
jgi:phosphoribosylformylglycinamidine synthase